MAKFIDENISYDVFIQWLKEGSEMEFLYEDTSIKINYIKINYLPKQILQSDIRIFFYYISN